MKPARLLAGLIVGIFLFTSVQLHAQEDWPMYGRNLRHTFSNDAARIKSSNVTSLKPLWTFPPTDTISASPTVVDGVLYVGAWDGFFYALDAESGALVWKFQVHCDNAIVPVPPQCLPPGQNPPARFFTQGGLITSTAAVSDEQVYFAAGKTVYSLKRRTVPSFGSM